MLYREGRDVEDYLSQAGEARENADEGRISIVYPNGACQVTRSTLFWKQHPEVEAGSTIIVPTKAEGEEFDWGGFFT